MMYIYPIPLFMRRAYEVLNVLSRSSDGTNWLKLRFALPLARIWYFGFLRFGRKELWLAADGKTGGSGSESCE